MRDEPSWTVWGYSRGKYTLRSTHKTAKAANDAADVLDRKGISTRVDFRVRRVATYTEVPAPTVAREFRESQADRMQVRKQHMAYIKSGSNGTEIRSLPPEAL